MRSAMDSAGRLVILKPIRDRLGFTEGQAAEIQQRDGEIEKAIVRTRR